MYKIMRTSEYVHKILANSLSNSPLASITAIILGIAILVSLLVSFLETLPSCRQTPSTCSNPACDNDPILCPNSIICEPVPYPVLGVIGNICIYIFSVEYGLKFITCWAVSASDLDIVPDDLEENPPVYNLCEHYLRYIFDLKNLADLVTLLPFYIGLATGNHIGGSVYLRVFRILRLLKVVKKLSTLDKARRMANLLIGTLKMSSSALVVLFVGSFLGTVFFGSLIYEMEKGKFQCNEDYPGGEYMRISANGAGLQISPYSSVPTSMYFIFVTLASVGFGDICPTTWEGRFISCVAILVGLLIIALPAGVISLHFSKLHEMKRVEQAQEAADELHWRGRSDSEITALFASVNKDSSQYLDIFEVKKGLGTTGLRCSKHMLLRMLRDRGKDLNGKIYLDEFIQMVREIEKWNKFEIPYTSAVKLRLSNLGEMRANAQIALEIGKVEIKERIAYYREQLSVLEKTEESLRDELSVAVDDLSSLIRD